MAKSPSAALRVHRDNEEVQRQRQLVQQATEAVARAAHGSDAEIKQAGEDAVVAYDNEGNTDE